MNGLLILKCVSKCIEPSSEPVHPYIKNYIVLGRGRGAPNRQIQLGPPLSWPVLSCVVLLVQPIQVHSACLPLSLCTQPACRYWRGLQIKELSWQIKVAFGGDAVSAAGRPGAAPASSLMDWMGCGANYRRPTG